MYFRPRSFLFLLKLFIPLVLIPVLSAEIGDASSPAGSLSILLPSGSLESPSYTVASSGLSGRIAFRGQVKSTSSNHVLFNRVPDLLDPTILSWPFKDGIFASVKARALAVLDSNQSLLRIDLISGGSGYSKIPDVYVALPSEGNRSWVNHEPALASATINSGAVNSIVLDPSYKGKGYQTVPKVTIQGGAHFLRCAEKGSPENGKFFRILSNTGDTITLDNPLSENIGLIFKTHTMVEVFESWTLGSLFGYSGTQLSDGNSTVADYVYLLKPSAQQNGTVQDYQAHYHDGTSWKEVNGSNASTAETIIYPDESFILARRSNSPLELNLSGVALTQNSFVQIPAAGKRFLMNNPFGVDVMLSDLIPSLHLTASSLDTQKWLTSASQEQADNIQILNDGVWTSYWHDGTNSGISENASLTARLGTGVAGSMTLQDLSMSSGIITSMTNPLSGNVVVTSANHQLRNGISVVISNAYGYKTNDSTPKQQVDEDGNVVSTGQGLLIESAVNGIFEIVNVDTNTFELSGKSGNCDFTGTANWKTGSAGAGYTKDAYVSFVGGGGTGAQGIAHVVGGSVRSITITEPGYGYISAPKVFVHSGGWRRVGAGNAPFNDVLVPAGSGIHLYRNHPNGLASFLRVDTPLD